MSEFFRHNRIGAAAVGLLLGALTLSGCTVPDQPLGRDSVSTPTAPSAPAPPESATESARPDVTAAPPTHENGNPGEYQLLLEGLAVKGRAPMTGYEREEFGQRWSDDVRVAGGRNGCDTRNDILRRDLEDPRIRPGTQGCLVESGTLDGPYSGETMEFVRGTETSGDIHIDHVVALADAWAKGAQQLDDQARADFANDPRNLLAVDGGLNQQKGAGDAATWLPPNREFRCEYAQRQIRVKADYGLWVTAAERDALSRQLDTCP